MFGNSGISTLSLLEKQIQTLEYAYYKNNKVKNFDLITQIEIELGHLYNSKMQIAKTLQNEPIFNKKFTNIKTYPSKINKERAEDSSATDQRLLSKLRITNKYKQHSKVTS